MPATEFLYNDRLLEEVVTLHLNERLKAGDREPYETYHSMADDFYGLMSGADRLAAFQRLHLYFFARSGFKSALESAVARFPLLSRVDRVMVGPALKNEYADLARKDSSNTLILEIRPPRFLEPEALRAFLQRELTLVSDILDPRFRYSPELPSGLNLSQENLFRDRYGFLWRTSVDARLVRSGLEKPEVRDRRRAEFGRLYSSLEAALADRTFSALWERKFLTHPELRDLAQNLSNLLKLAGIEQTVEDCGHLPGSPCPLCRFPTHHWGKSDPRLERAIAADFPEWKAEHGLCDRCAELYGLKIAA